MDDIVKQAMAKWPNVPDCYGWLGLDARGAWRMRDERAQQSGALGDKLAHEALIGFINRNYASDGDGRWFFQNGPQRVFVNLEATPYIARTDPQRGLVLHTGEAVEHLERAYMTELGDLIIEADGKVAQVEDRDVTEMMEGFEVDGVLWNDDTLVDWLERGLSDMKMRYHRWLVPVKRIEEWKVPIRFDFQRVPKPDPE